jgi:hypothetical protein
MPPAFDTSQDLAGPGLAIGLGVTLFIGLIILVKICYSRYRRVQSIHEVPETAPLGLRAGATPTFASTKRMSQTRRAGELDEKNRDARCPPFRPVSQRQSGLLVGMLGDPSWEIKIARTVDVTRHRKALEQAEDEVAQVVHEMVVRPLSRMSSRATHHSRKSSVDSSLFTSSPYLNGGEQPLLMLTSLYPANLYALFALVSAQIDGHLCGHV